MDHGRQRGPSVTNIDHREEEGGKKKEHQHFRREELCLRGDGIRICSQMLRRLVTLPVLPMQLCLLREIESSGSAVQARAERPTASESLVRQMQWAFWLEMTIFYAHSS